MTNYNTKICTLLDDVLKNAPNGPARDLNTVSAWLNGTRNAGGLVRLTARLRSKIDNVKAKRQELKKNHKLNALGMVMRLAGIHGGSSSKVKLLDMFLQTATWSPDGITPGENALDDYRNSKYRRTYLRDYLEAVEDARVAALNILKHVKGEGSPPANIKPAELVEALINIRDANPGMPERFLMPLKHFIVDIETHVSVVTGPVVLDGEGNSSYWPSVFVASSSSSSSGNP